MIGEGNCEGFDERSCECQAHFVAKVEVDCEGHSVEVVEVGHFVEVVEVGHLVENEMREGLRCQVQVWQG